MELEESCWTNCVVEGSPSVGVRLRRSLQGEPERRVDNVSCCWDGSKCLTLSEGRDAVVEGAEASEGAMMSSILPRIHSQ